MKDNNNIKKLSSKEIAKQISKGNKIILSKTITLLESTKEEHNKIAEEVIDLIYEKTGDSIRIGITGAPGVGKSTFIESLVKHILPKKNKIAILAIDPSSQKTKGSILGDKTRMEEISGEENVFIRPSPAGNKLGGVSLKTRETILLCEAAGFNIIIIETVGVGQSEISVKYMIDVFLLLMLATAGDELQGIKKGIMEMADIVAINKTENKEDIKTNKAILNYKNALHLMKIKKSAWLPIVEACSALNNYNINTIWKKIKQYENFTKKNKYWKENRKQQSKYWVKETINQKILQDLYSKFHVKQKIKEVENLVFNEKITSNKAAKIVIDIYKNF